MTKDEILNAVEDAIQQGERYFRIDLPRPERIVFKRNGTIGGTSNFAKKELMFQLDFAENEPNYINTVKHEVAHWVQRAIYGYFDNYGRKVMPHGKEWKGIMRRVYGLEPTRCHSYDTTKTKVKRQRRFAWSCPCGQDLQLTTRMHNKCIRTKQQTKGSNRYPEGTYGKICSSCRKEIFPKVGAYAR